MDAPSGRVPEQGPEWVLVVTEAFGGGTPDLGFFLEVWGFIGGFGVGLTLEEPTESPRGRGAPQGGGGTLHPRGAHETPLR